MLWLNKINYILTMELVHRFLQGVIVSIAAYGTYITPYVIKAFYIKTEDWKGLWALSINWPLAIPFFMVGVGTVFMFSKWIASFCGILKTKVLAFLVLSSVVVPMHVVYYQCLVNELNMQDCLFSLDLFGHNIFSIIREWSLTERMMELERLLSRAQVDYAPENIAHWATNSDKMGVIQKLASDIIEDFHEKFYRHEDIDLSCLPAPTDTSGTSLTRVMGKDCPDKSSVIGSAISSGFGVLASTIILSKTDIVKVPSNLNVESFYGCLLSIVLISGRIGVLLWKNWKDDKNEDEFFSGKGKEEKRKEEKGKEKVEEDVPTSTYKSPELDSSRDEDEDEVRPFSGERFWDMYEDEETWDVGPSYSTKFKKSFKPDSSKVSDSSDSKVSDSSDSEVSKVGEFVKESTFSEDDNYIIGDMDLDEFLDRFL